MKKIQWMISLMLAISFSFFYCGKKSDSKPEEQAKAGEPAEAPAAGEEQAKAGEPEVAETTEVAQAEPIDVKKILRPCAPCHYLDKGADKLKSGLGPGLLGVYNRVPVIFGNKSPYAKWDEAALDSWLFDPNAVKRGTKMTYKVTNDEKRKKVIEALKLLK